MAEAPSERLAADGVVEVILSFDLDGVIADTDNGMLALLHQATRDGKPGAAHDLEQYYARRQVVLDPREFCLPGDAFHIVSGRVPSAHYITQLWVGRWFGTLARERLHLVANGEVETAFAEGRDADACAALAERKLEAVQFIGAAVHFDNNLAIVRRLRQAGITTVMVGGGLR